jgi:hypothetical protein
VTIQEPADSTEITRTDAYELCKEAAVTYGSVPGDLRDVYARIEGSDVNAVDGWWRVWIPGVTHPGGEPVNVALTCVLNGYIDKPNFYSYGGVASDYYPDRAAYFDELLTPYSD